jgi:hypothetical protein
MIGIPRRLVLRGRITDSAIEVLGWSLSSNSFSQSEQEIAVLSFNVSPFWDL